MELFQLLGSFLAIGIGFILLFILIGLVIGTVSLYLSGKIVKSINDEFLSAIKAIAYGFLLSIGITIVMWLFNFLGAKITSLQSVFGLLNSLMPIFYLVVFFIIAKKIYDLSVGKTFLMLIVAAVINGAIGAILAIIFGGFLFGTIKDKIASPVDTESVAVMEDEIIEEETVTEEYEFVDEETAEEEAEPRKRPGIPKKEPEEEFAEAPAEEMDTTEPEITVVDCAEDPICIQNNLNTCTPTKFEGGTISKISDGPNCQFTADMDGKDLSCVIPPEKWKSALTNIMLLDKDFLTSYCTGSVLDGLEPPTDASSMRARDTSRIADLNNISQALEIYYASNGSYPPSSGNFCLKPGTEPADSIGAYLKSGKIIVPISTEGHYALGCEASYFYKPLSNEGVLNKAYALAVDMETWEMANFELHDNPDNISKFTSYNNVIAEKGKLSQESSDPRMSIYIVTP